MNTNEYAAAAAMFKNPVPSHGPKRNTACHQCRKRKLKCDTKRPCSTCVKSHAYALAHATEDADLPDEPECTYGDRESRSQPDSAPVDSGDGAASKEPPQPQNKVEQLEGRISELEGLLRQMQLALDASHDRAGAPPAISPNFSSAATDVMSPGVSQYLDNAASFNGGIHDMNGMVASSSTGFAAASVALTPDPGVFDGSLMQAADGSSVFNSMDFSQFGQASVADMDDFAQMSDPNFGGAMIPHSLAQDRKTQLLLMGWPLHLPEPEITRHLVHAFFAFNMHAGRLFHGPTFLASLELSPQDPRFPFSALLHSMCAVGSLYTADIPQPSIQRRIQFPFVNPATGNGQYFVIDELFPGRWRQWDQRPDSFAETQVRFARLVGEAALDRGEHLLECLQAQIVLTWFYICQARWSEAFLAAGQAVRCTVPCGFNIASPFHSTNPSFVNRPDKPPSILPDALNVTDREMRINMFWIAYAMERQQACANSFAMVLDDLDIFQLLPLRGDQYEQGIDVPVSERQWSHDRTMLLHHPPTQTDSFILFIKASILLSQVKNFNLRFRGRYFSGDAAMYSPSASPADKPDKLDPRDTQAFQELDHLTLSFRQTWPGNFRNPVQDEMIDAYLYSASCAACLAIIVLHEPHAAMSDPQDISANRVLKAARALLDLMYAINATSYDISLLDQLPILSWQSAGRVLVKALRGALDTKNYEAIAVLQSEIAFVHSLLAKAGERMPLAYRYKKMVYDFLATICGRQFVESLPQTSYHKGHGEPLRTYDDPMVMGYQQF